MLIIPTPNNKPIIPPISDNKLNHVYFGISIASMRDMSAYKKVSTTVSFVAPKWLRVAKMEDGRWKKEEGRRKNKNELS